MDNSAQASWIIAEGGKVIDRKHALGDASLSPLDRLILCIWTADYAMRNAGDLAVALDLHPPLVADATALARDLGMHQTLAAFSLPQAQLEAEYFERLEAVISEIIDSRRQRPE